MTGRLNKVDASVDTVVDEFEPVDSVFLFEVCVESGINVVDDRFPAGSVSSVFPVHRNGQGTGSSPLFVVDKVTESWSIDYRQLESDAILLNICSFSSSPWTHQRNKSLPALMLSMLTVLPLSVPGAGTSFGW